MTVNFKSTGTIIREDPERSGRTARKNNEQGGIRVIEDCKIPESKIWSRRF